MMEVFQLLFFSVNTLGEMTATRGTIGALSIGSTSLYMGDGVWKGATTPFFVNDAGNFSLGDKLFFDYSAGSLTVTGIINALAGGALANWIITENILKSAESGARVDINSLKMRVSIIDSTETIKTAHGFMDGVPGHTGEEYGFYIAAGNVVEIASPLNLIGMI